MLSIKQILLAILGASLSCIANAGMYSPTVANTCLGINATTPCVQQGWELGIYAMYAQSTGVDTRLDDIPMVSYPSTQANSNSFNLQPQQNWGYRVEGAYHFNAGGDISLNWTTLNQTNQVTTQERNITPNFMTLNHLIGDAPLEVVTSSLRNDYNAVNLEFGQLINFGERMGARFHAGVEYASIDQYIMQTAFNIPTLLLNSNITNRYKGGGLRLGMDDTYALPAGFSLVGSTAVALLYGSAEADSTRDLIEDNLIIAAQTTTSDNDTHRFVPSIEGKLGLKYSYPFAQGIFNIEAGFKVAEYWDAVNNELTSLEVNTNDLNGNYAYQGAYAGLAWVG